MTMGNGKNRLRFLDSGFSFYGPVTVEFVQRTLGMEK